MYITICVIIVTSMLVQLIWHNHLVSNYPNIGRLVFIIPRCNDPLLLVWQDMLPGSYHGLNPIHRQLYQTDHATLSHEIFSQQQVM